MTGTVRVEALPTGRPAVDDRRTSQVVQRFRQDAVEVPVTVKVEMTPRLLAEAFANMSDEAQAQFFIDVAEIAATWGPDPHAQWYLVGRHLATCSCATDESRELVATIARAVAHGA